MKLFAIAAAGAVLAVTSTPVLAGPEKGPSTQVTYDDLDLSTVEGQKELEQRVELAARKMCQADRQNTGSRMRSSEKRKCLDNARRSAKRQTAAIIQEQQRGG